MDRAALQLEVRNALVLADELGRYEHGLGNDALAGQLAAVRTALADLERDLGRSRSDLRPNAAHVPHLSSFVERLRNSTEEVPPELRPRVERLAAILDRIVFASCEPQAALPSKPVLGVLPLRRLVPQTIHSLLDYAAAAAFVASVVVGRTPRARAVGAVLAAKVGGSALITDTRLSLARWTPIELHEILDHAYGLVAALAPRALGYRSRDPLAARIQTLTGLALVAVSLVSDYRAEHGVASPVRSRGGPRRRFAVRRVPEVQRPLEGLSSPSVLPRVRV